MAVERGDGRTVAQYGDGVGHLGDFVELVGNQDAGNALTFEFQQQLQQRVAVGFVQAGSGLVQYEQLHFLGQCLRDFNELLLAHAQIGNQGAGGFFQPHFFQQRLGLQERRRPVNHPAVCLLVAQKDVFRN